MRAAAHRLARLAEHPQVAGVDLAALAHPVGRDALVGDADLEGRIAEQPTDDGLADRAGAAGDENAIHRAARLAQELERTEWPGGAYEPRVRSDQGHIQALCERDVGGVVEGDIPP